MLTHDAISCQKSGFSAPFDLLGIYSDYNGFREAVNLNLAIMTKQHLRMLGPQD